MPYIKPDDRHKFNVAIDALQKSLIRVPRDKRKGALNYVVSRLALGCFGEGYHEISDRISALRDAADEIVRRRMVPREDVAIEKNGDLPEYE